MNKKFKGFSLAELLISLLIISIVLSAAIPTITKKAGADRETIWRWASEGNNAYFGTGSNQSAIIGLNTTPMADEDLSTLLDDSEVTDSTDANRGKIGDINIGNLKFSNNGDKFIILKKTLQDDNSNFMNSHISFFNLENSVAATTADITYGGRLALDSGNIALGMATLQSIDSDNIGENTALGHFGLMRTTSGFRNTAVGKKALSYNTTGAYNTGLGYGALFELGAKTSTDSTDAYYENTAVGALSQLEKQDGKNNTSVGAQSLRKNEVGSNNTAIGQNTLTANASGSNNTAVGAQACRYLEKGSNNICVGYLAGNSTGLKEDDYGLYIGAGDEAPVISGHSKKITSGSNTFDKEININARYFNVNTFDKGENILNITTYSGSDGYGTNLSTVGYYGTLVLGLRKNGTETTSVGLIGYQDHVVLNTYDEKNSYNRDLVFNSLLRLGYPTSTDKNIRLYTLESDSTEYPLLLNGHLNIEDGTSNIDLSKTKGITISEGTTKSYITLDLKGELSTYAAGNISLIGKNIKIYTNDYGTTLSPTSNTLYMGEDHPIKIDTSNGDITLKSITGNSSQSVATSINDLYSKVSGVTSDARKKNITGDNTAGLKEINALEVKNFTYKDDKEKTPHVGVIAQQLQKIFPNSVFEDSEGFLKIKTEEIFYGMVNAIKELYAQLQDLTAKITGLDKRIEALEKENKQLKEQNNAFEKRLKKLEAKSK
jgi:prepilin-type N-terminal cleavage/methylation domain-containing protein